MKTDKTKKRGTFRYISLGDIHLGHRNTPTSLIIRNLDRTITDEVLKAIDMVIITGDVFDRQLNNGDDDVHQINRWMTVFMMRCAKFNTMMEIVEGTPSHDRRQSRFFVEQMQNADIPVELHYADRLQIRYIEKLDAHFLYVPDKHHPDPNVTLAEIRALMSQLNLEQVDFAVMHGAFSYQLPSIVPEPTHDEASYLALVKYHILIGHVHLQTINERIYAAGSFDRICHGDESPKGMFDITVKEDGTTTPIFVVNRGARRYDTYDCHGMDTKELNVLVRKKVAELPKGSAIRLRCEAHDVANGDIATFSQEFPQFTWTVSPEKTTAKKKTISEVVAEFDMSKYLSITPETIQGLVKIEMKKLTQDENTIERCLTRLTAYT